MRVGVRLALDLGQARIGVAACDPEGRLAYPVATVAAGAGELEELCRLVSEYQPLEVIVGLPRSLTGAEGPAATGIRARAQHLARALAGVAAVRLVDERFTTVTAARMLRAAGQSVRQQRRRIDAAAAAEILDLTLAAERTRGLPIGELVSADAPGGPSGEVDMP